MTLVHDPDTNPTLRFFKARLQRDEHALKTRAVSKAQLRHADGNKYLMREFKATLILFLLGEQGTQGEQMQRTTQHKHTSSQHRGWKKGGKLNPMAAWFVSFCFIGAENLPNIRWNLEPRLVLSGGTNTVEKIFLISHRL